MWTESHSQRQRATPHFSQITIKWKEYILLWFLRVWLGVCNQYKPRGTAACWLLKHSAMLELPRGWNASGHKGVFQRLQKQVKEKRERGEGGEVVIKLSLPLRRRDAQILMTFNIESDFIFFLIMTFLSFSLHFDRCKGGGNKGRSF